MNAKLSISVGCYADRSWYVAMVSTPYDDSGRPGVPSVLARRVVDLDRLVEVVNQELAEAVFREQESHRKREMGAAERE